jgi:integrase
MMEYAESPDVAYRPYGSNPCRRSVKFKEYRRKRHIRTDEFPLIGQAMRAAAEEHPREMAAILCILLAGSRVTELAHARHDQLDTARMCIVLREHKTARTGEDRVIWLPSQAVQLIRNLPVDRSGYLFGRGLDRFGLRRVWLKVVTAAGCPDVRMQDLRRTFASVAKSRGVGLHAVGELLGHKQTETTNRYAFLFEERAAGLAQETGDAISGLLEGGKS